MRKSIIGSSLVMLFGVSFAIADTYYEQFGGQKAYRPAMGILGSTLGRFELWNGTGWINSAIDNYSQIGIEGHRKIYFDSSGNISIKALGLVKWSDGTLLRGRNHTSDSNFNTFVSSGTCSTCGPSTNTWAYFYIYDNNGSFAFERSATAPESSKRYKTGDSTRVYVATTYGDREQSSYDDMISYGGNGLGGTTLFSSPNCEAYVNATVPNNPIYHKIHLRQNCSGGMTPTTTVYTNSSCTTGGNCFVISNTSSEYSDATCEIPNGIVYVKTSLGATCSVLVNTMGYAY